MSDFEDYFEEHQGYLNTVGYLTAVKQRQNQIEQQRKHSAALREQTVALENQNKIEKNRARIEEQRLEIEKQRLEAEDADREMRREQAEQVKDVRNLLVDATAGLKRFRKRHLS